jgi:hypothetical protein
VNGGDWTIVEPTTRLSDSLSHEYPRWDNAPAGGVTSSGGGQFKQAAANTVVR